MIPFEAPQIAPLVARSSLAPISPGASEPFAEVWRKQVLQTSVKTELFQNSEADPNRSIEANDATVTAPETVEDVAVEVHKPALASVATPKTEAKVQDASAAEFLTERPTETGSEKTETQLRPAPTPVPTVWDIARPVDQSAVAFRLQLTTVEETVTAPIAPPDRETVLPEKFLVNAVQPTESDSHQPNSTAPAPIPKAPVVATASGAPVLPDAAISPAPPQVDVSVTQPKTSEPKSIDQDAWNAPPIASSGEPRELRESGAVAGGQMPTEQPATRNPSPLTETRDRATPETPKRLFADPEAPALPAQNPVQMVRGTMPQEKVEMVVNPFAQTKAKAETTPTSGFTGSISDPLTKAVSIPLTKSESTPTPSTQPERPTVDLGHLTPRAYSNGSAVLMSPSPQPLTAPIQTTFPLFSKEPFATQSSLDEPDLALPVTPTGFSPVRPGAAHPMQAHAPQVAQQIATATIQSKAGTTEIALNPEELGKVRLALTTNEKGISVSIMAERPETAELMRRNVENLAREFRDLGYDSVSFSFEDPPEQSGDQPDERAAQDTGADQASPDPTPSAPITTVALRGGLDLKL